MLVILIVLLICSDNLNQVKTEGRSTDSKQRQFRAKNVSTLRRTALTVKSTQTPIPLILKGIGTISYKLGIHSYLNGDYRTVNRKLKVPVLSPRPTLQRIKFYLPHAFLAGCPPDLIQDWICSMCKKIGSHGKYVTTLEERKYLIFGIMAVDTLHEDIIVSFRGTTSLPNVILNVLWFTDIFPRDNPSEPIPSYSLVDSLTNRYFVQKSVFEQLVHGLKDLLEIYPKYKVILGGHSLGGGLATVTLFLLKNGNYFPNVHFELYSVGSPRAGNQGMADYMNALADTPMVRITGPTETVPVFAPAAHGFVHFNNEFHIFNNSGEGLGRYCSTKVYEDQTCSQGVPFIYTYLTYNSDHWTNYLGIPSLACAYDQLLPYILDFIFPLTKSIPKEIQDLMLFNRPINITLLLNEINDFLFSGIYKFYMSKATKSIIQ